ncbi:MAG: linear amide C-N hydrolase [Clostridia bacterium]|nr:linear amide C-N hydrolase [Clostridia bacterium]
MHTNLIMTKGLSLILSAAIGFFGSVPGFRSKQLDSLETVTRVADNYYIMDYTYNYDLDTLLESNTGNSTTAGLLLYSVADVFLQLNPSAKKVISNLGFYGRINSKAISKVMQKALSSTGFGCTTFNASTPSGEKLFARNYDYMESPGMTVWTHPENGYASVSTVSLYFLGYGGSFLPDNRLTSILTLIAPYIPVDGMNEKGLSIGVLELETPETFTQTEKKDITTTAVIRTVLDHAATVDEAVSIFRKYDMHDLLGGGCTYHYQIADASGKTAIIEYVNGEATVLRPGKSGTLVATNFWLSQGVDDPDGMGQNRYETAKRMLKKTNYRLSENRAMDILKATHVENEDMHGYICSTLWSVVYNNTKRTFTLCAMYDYGNRYHFSLNNPLHIEKRNNS